MWHDWEKKTLGELAYINMGQSPDSSSVSEDNRKGMPFLQGNTEFGVKFPTHHLYCTQPKKKCSEGDFLISVRAPVGALNVANQNYCIGRGLAALNVPKEKSGYLWHALNNFAPELAAVSQGSTFDAINSNNLAELEFHLPKDENEQKAIAEVLDTVDEAIAATQAMLDKQDKIKDGLLQDLLTRGVDANGKLRPAYKDSPVLYKQSPLGFIPKEWDVKELDESNILIIDGDRGEHYPSAHEFLSNGYCLFLSATNVTKRGFKFERTDFITKEKDSKLRKGKVSRNDVVLTTRGTVGNFAFYTNEIPYEHIRINSGMVILRNEEPGLNTEFFFNSFGSFIFKQENQRSGSGSAQPQLPIKDLVKFNFLKPSIEEQIRINQKIASFTKQQVLTENELTKLKKLKAGLMQDLLTGKKRISKNQREAA